MVGFRRPVPCSCRQITHCDRFLSSTGIRLARPSSLSIRFVWDLPSPLRDRQTLWGPFRTGEDSDPLCLFGNGSEVRLVSRFAIGSGPCFGLYGGEQTDADSPDASRRNGAPLAASTRGGHATTGWPQDVCAPRRNGTSLDPSIEVGHSVSHISPNLDVRKIVPSS